MEANIKKHGIDFKLASKVFDDPNFALIKDRSDAAIGEQRWHALGVASVAEEGALLAVAHVYRGRNEEEIIRIFSARAASKGERRLYTQ